MSDSPQVPVSTPVPAAGRAQNLKTRATALSESLKTRGTNYDHVFARTEFIATLGGAALIAFGGILWDVNGPLGVTLLGLGTLATAGALALVVKREKGILETLVEAVNAANDALAIRLEADRELAEFRQALEEQKRLTDAAKMDGVAQRTATEARARREQGDRDNVWNALDRQRRARLRAVRKMVETAEAALLHDADVPKSANEMLDKASVTIRRAVGCGSDDFFTVSIFRREIRDRLLGERMYRIGAYWTDPEENKYSGLSWPKGRGYTGILWARAVDNTDALVVLPDTTLPGIREEYPVDDYDEEREAHYVSVAAVPILIGRTEDIWGVVTMTSNQKGVFDRPKGVPTQGVEIAQDIAYVAALLAGLDRRKALSGVVTAC